MNNISKINSNQLREVLPVVDQCCRQLQIDFYIIGALAKEIWFAAEGIVTGGTKDVDFAIFVSDEHQFYQLKSALIDSHGFHQAKENSFVLFAPNKTQIDILPFGSLEVENGVTVAGQGLTKIKVNGFKEVYLESVQEVKLLDDKLYKIATLPGIVLLKLVAFDDRPEQRGKDPLDCMAIIENYFNLQSDLIWDHHNDLFDDDRPLVLFASRVIGREMRKPLLENAQLMNRVVGILERHISFRERSPFIAQIARMAGDSDHAGAMTIEDYVSCLSEILMGIKEEQ